MNLHSLEPESSASADSATSANMLQGKLYHIAEKSQEKQFDKQRKRDGNPSPSIMEIILYFSSVRHGKQNISDTKIQVQGY